MRLSVNQALSLAALLILSACGGDSSKARALPAAAAGPAADYPVVLGRPYTIGTTTWTPADKLNYDEVGLATVAGRDDESISIAHKTLPLPSYVEITSLASGRTILARVERRGPLDNTILAELSRGAAAQLGITGSDRAAIRLRRVNPPEVERSQLRSGQRAPERMETPGGLLDALVRKLERQSPGATTARAAVAQVSSSPKKPVRSVVAAPTPAATASPRVPAAARGRDQLVVQVGAFSARERAAPVAAALGAQVSPAGRLWRVRIGPFASRPEADAALAKARSAGYSDARIQRAD